MNPEKINDICDALLESGADPEIVQGMRGNMLAQHGFELSGASPKEAIDMLLAAFYKQRGDEIRKRLKDL